MGMHSTYTATHYKDLNIDWQARAVTRHGEDILLTRRSLPCCKCCLTTAVRL